MVGKYKKNRIKSKIISGVITSLYKAGQDNSNEINSFNFISEDGVLLSSSIYINNKKDINLFSKGKRVKILYIYDELKSGALLI
ncbi:hypothetical protein [Avibacterium paragallinarum]|uniref:Uncharacterized protein n=1 Tax=Avibacterium paragallinarum TaxID=728 RepID=A0ABU7QRP1_AVIPA|nr:hypothetical protein [Avibacterium paragallinarum]